jgi:hypothetical protein
MNWRHELSVKAQAKRTAVVPRKVTMSKITSCGFGSNLMTAASWRSVDLPCLVVRFAATGPSRSMILPRNTSVLRAHPPGPPVENGCEGVLGGNFLLMAPAMRRRAPACY